MRDKASAGYSIGVHFVFMGVWMGLALVQSTAATPTPHVLTYGHNRDVPLPLLVGGSDFAFLDWDDDGDKDLLVGPNGRRLILRRNIGTPKEPRFANVYQVEPVVLDDARLGRFFALMRRPGLEGYEAGQAAMIAFEMHAAIKEIGQRKLRLHLFVPRRTEHGVAWDVIPARRPDGALIEEFADSWMCPTVAVADWDDDGREDLIVGGWHPSLAQPAGKYTWGFNHPDESWNPWAGRVYVMRNVSAGDRLMFDAPQLVHADGAPIKTYGFIYPKVIDIDGDGLLDLLATEHRPGLRWYRNVGTRQAPKLTAAGEVADARGEPIRSVLSLRACFEDLDDDGRSELITASYFAFTIGLLRFDHTPTAVHDLSHGWAYQGYLPMAGAPETPVTAQGICTVEVIDWDGDGDRDLLLGAEPGTPMLLRNTGTNTRPIWAEPERLRFVDGRPLEYYGKEVGRGSVWGPIEFYLERTLPRLADWDGDGTLDMVTGSMAARLLWLRGQKVDGELQFEQPRVFTMRGRPFDVAHRVQPVVLDWNGDGSLDIVALDTDNVVTLWLGAGTSELRDPRPFSGPDGAPLKLNPTKMTVTSGRRGLGMVDWDADGHMDLITYNAFGPTVWGGEARLHLAAGPDAPMQFRQAIPLFENISHHNGGITIVDWNDDGYLDIMIGGDHTHLEAGSEPRGQFFWFDGRELPVPPARR